MNFEPIEFNGLTTFISKSFVSDEAIKQVVDTFNTLTPQPGRTATGVDKSKKDSLDLTIVPNHCLKIQKEIEDIKNSYVEYYSLNDFVPRLGITEHMNIQKYPLKGGFHKIHADRGYGPTDSTRELVYMTFLNDVHSGGETEFLFYRLKIQPVKGLTLIWPAGWTHIHRGIPSPTTEKMIFTGWFSPL